ncbi:MAG: hypothetical protein ACI9JN_000706 [Bacteroidia bacterium]|jgi:hypothetical protein
MKYLFILLSSIVALSGCKDDDPVDKKIVLTTAETNDLQFLREEEKLARDVYLYAYDVYKESIFSNISSSEQRHMDAVLALLNTYGIEDPVGTQGAGVFTNQVLQQLYDQLIITVDSSKHMRLL